MEEEIKKYLDYEGLSLYHQNLEAAIEQDERVIASALNELDSKVTQIQQMIEENEETTAYSLNDLNSRKANSSDLNSVALSGNYNDLNNKPEIYRVISVTSNLTNQIASQAVTGVANSGKHETVLYVNGGNENYTIVISTNSGYITPDGNAIELTCSAEGYCEVSYLNINGTIYVRGL